MRTLILILVLAVPVAGLAQDMSKEERKANRDRVKAEQKFLNDQAKADKNRLPEPENPIALISRRLATQDIPALKSAEAAKLYEIKGDRLGMTLEEFGQHHYSSTPANAKAKYRGFIGPYCVDHDEPSLFLNAQEAEMGVVACSPSSSIYNPAYARIIGQTQPTLANVPLKGIGFKFYKGHLFSIVAVFEAKDYAALKASFVEKFGSAISNLREVQNRMGAKFDDDTATWANGVSAIEIRQRQTDLETSALVVYLPKVQEEVTSLLPKPKKDL
jgi:hypothetical protein